MIFGQLGIGINNTINSLDLGIGINNGPFNWSLESEINNEIKVRNQQWDPTMDQLIGDRN